MKIRFALAAGTALLLAACSGSPPEPVPTPANDTLPEGEVINEMPVINAIPAPLPSETPTPAPTPTADPATTAAQETQMYEDADATGMTARVDRDAQPADTTEVPAQEKK